MKEKYKYFIIIILKLVYVPSPNVRTTVLEGGASASDVNILTFSLPCHTAPLEAEGPG